MKNNYKFEISLLSFIVNANLSEMTEDDKLKFKSIFNIDFNDTLKSMRRGLFDVFSFDSKCHSAYSLDLGMLPNFRDCYTNCLPATDSTVSCSVFALNGLAGSGKSYVVDLLSRRSGVKIVEIPFARTLKNALAFLLNIDSRAANSNLFKKDLFLIAEKSYSGRELLTLFGTEFSQVYIKKSIYAEVAILELSRLHFDQVAAIPDARFDHELLLLEHHQIPLGVVVSDDFECVAHASEKLRIENPDVIIRNNKKHFSLENKKLNEQLALADTKRLLNLGVDRSLSMR